MAILSNDLATKLQNVTLGAPTPGYTGPTNVKIRLYTSAPTPAGGGTEVSGGGYAPVTLANNSTNWPATNGAGEKKNGTLIEFPNATAPWGTVVAIAITDGGTPENILYVIPMDTPTAYNTGDRPSFPVGSLFVAIAG